MRKAVVVYASQWFSGSDLYDIESAVGEALANSAEHGGRQGGQIEVHCEVDDAGLIVEIKDDGDGFDGWERPEARLPFHPSVRGHGMFLMHRLMDTVTYVENGTRLQMRKRLPVTRDDEDLLEA